jgi:release factor glutamine methyltransferase
MSGSIRPALFRRLVKKFGRSDAERQLRWLKRELLPMAREDRPSLTGLLSRLLRDEPLAYVIGELYTYKVKGLPDDDFLKGSQPFGSLSLRVAPPVLIPRPETEQWTYELLNRLASQEIDERKDWRLLDLCTGSGCIPLLLCKEWPDQLSGSISAYGIDIGDEAIALAEQNASRTLGDRTAHSQALRSFQPRKFDIFSREFSEWVTDAGGFDVVTSNPPYIPQRDWELLPTSVREFEDPRALQGGDDGLVFYRRIAELLKTTAFLKPGGRLAVEFGINQAEEVQRIFQDTGALSSVDIWTDCFGIQRTAFCRARRD